MYQKKKFPKAGAQPSSPKNHLPWSREESMSMKSPPMKSSIQPPKNEMLPTCRMRMASGDFVCATQQSGARTANKPAQT